MSYSHQYSQNAWGQQHHPAASATHPQLVQQQPLPTLQQSHSHAPPPQLQQQQPQQQYQPNYQNGLPGQYVPASNPAQARSFRIDIPAQEPSYAPQAPTPQHYDRSNQNTAYHRQYQQHDGQQMPQPQAYGRMQMQSQQYYPRPTASDQYQYPSYQQRIQQTPQYPLSPPNQNIRRPLIQNTPSPQLQQQHIAQQTPSPQLQQQQRYVQHQTPSPQLQQQRYVQHQTPSPSQQNYQSYSQEYYSQPQSHPPSQAQAQPHPQSQYQSRPQYFSQSPPHHLQRQPISTSPQTHQSLSISQPQQSMQYDGLQSPPQQHQHQFLHPSQLHVHQTPLQPQLSSNAAFSPPKAQPQAAPVMQPKAPPKKQRPKLPPLERWILLVALAEQYLDAAYQTSSAVTSRNRSKGTDSSGYHKHIATALACFNAVLKNWSLPPRNEATVRLRYANVLHEETEDRALIEELLNKGVHLCEKNRLIELKYQMQYLLVQVLFQKSRKAAMKILDGIVRDAETYKHVAWVYAFRFLRVSLCLQTSPVSELSAVQQNLKSISYIAFKRGDHGVDILSSVLSAWAHLRSGSSEAVENAQRAISHAHSTQNAHSKDQIPQVQALVEIVNVLSLLLEPNPPQAKQQTRPLLDILDRVRKSNDFTEDGSFSVLIEYDQASTNTLKTSGEALKVGEEGRGVHLQFSWLPAQEILIVGYLLCGIIYSFEQMAGGGKAKEFFRSGLQMIQDQSEPTQSTSLISRNAKASGRLLVQYYFRLYLLFGSCTQADWTSASSQLEELKQDQEKLGKDPEQAVMAFTKYVAGMILHGTGHLEEALKAYDEPELSIESLNTTVRSSAQLVRQDLSLLATLSKIVILRGLKSPVEQQQADMLLSSIEPLCLTHPNSGIGSVFYLLTATSSSSETILKSKQYLQHALTYAKKVANIEMISITLNFMSYKYFRGVVGDQAEKSAQAAYATAKQGGNQLWINTAERMMAETLETQGKLREAEALSAEAIRNAPRVVPSFASKQHQTDVDMHM